MQQTTGQSRYDPRYWESSERRAKRPKRLCRCTTSMFIRDQHVYPRPACSSLKRTCGLEHANILNVAVRSLVCETVCYQSDLKIFKQDGGSEKTYKESDPGRRSCRLTF